MASRGTIERTDRGWTIKPGTWREPKVEPTPTARLEEGRIVRVTFNFIVETAGTRDQVEEFVIDGLNGIFDLTADPILEDLGLRTDKPELLSRALGSYK